MSSLKELAALKTTVKVRGKEIDVFGVSVEGIAQLLHRFPALLKAMSGGSGFDKDGLIKAGPAAVAAVIAAGCGEPGDKVAEKAAASLGLESQLDLLTAILDLTFPSGVGPFVKKLEGLGLLAKALNQPSTSSDESQTS